MIQQNSATGKVTCEAFGCFEAAEEKINIPLGKTGEINLSVCSNCRPKFVCNSLETIPIKKNRKLDLLLPPRPECESKHDRERRYSE